MKVLDWCDLVLCLFSDEVHQRDSGSASGPPAHLWVQDSHVFSESHRPSLETQGTEHFYSKNRKASTDIWSTPTVEYSQNSPGGFLFSPDLCCRLLMFQEQYIDPENCADKIAEMTDLQMFVEMVKWDASAWCHQAVYNPSGDRASVHHYVPHRRHAQPQLIREDRLRLTVNNQAKARSRTFSAWKMAGSRAVNCNQSPRKRCTISVYNILDAFSCNKCVNCHWSS